MGKIERSAKMGGKLGRRLNRLDLDLVWRGHHREFGDRVRFSLGSISCEAARG
jgi:hypothetical protein